MSVLRSYLSLIKFGHTVFALPFALLGLALGLRAVYAADPGMLTWGWGALLALRVVLCMVFARSAAMAFNRYLDRRFDALNPRTAVREIPAGIISPGAALGFTVFCSAGFVATTWFINPLCFALSFVALAVILFYSYTKRITPLCHLVLGVGLSLAPIGAYLAATARFSALPVLFSVVVFTWVAGFDIIYALQDDEFDRSQGLRSIPAWLGKRRALAVSTGLHAVCAGVLLWAGWMGGFPWLFWIGAAVFIALLAYQHAIVSPQNLSRVNAAFATTNGLASIIFAAFAITAVMMA